MEYDREVMNELISKSNSWDRLVRFFENSDEIQDYYKLSREECKKYNCSSEAIMMIVTIEKLLENVNGK